MASEPAVSSLACVGREQLREHRMRLGSLRLAASRRQETGAGLAAVLVLGAGDTRQPRQAGPQQLALQLVGFCAAFWLDHVAHAGVQLVEGTVLLSEPENSM